jgi:hypothetical protein
VALRIASVAAMLVVTMGLLLSMATSVDAAGSHPGLTVSRLSHRCAAPRHLSFRLRLSKLAKGKEYELVIVNPAGHSVANVTIVARSSTYDRKKLKVLAAPGRLSKHKQRLHFILDERLTASLSKQVAGPQVRTLPQCRR